jgi:hypothetical protein
MRISHQLGDMRIGPVVTFAALNLAAPWGVRGLIDALAEGRQRQLLFWLIVIVLFTANQLAARQWHSWRWTFWGISTANILMLPLGAVSLATAIPSFPSLVYWPLLYQS